MWTPGFDGGNPQQFHVDIMAVGKEWVTDTLNISDEGQGVPMTHTLEGLAPFTDYIIRLNVSNKIGKGNSSEISVRTVALPPPAAPQSNLTVIIVVVVIILLAVVAGIIGLLVFKQKRNQQGGAKKLGGDTKHEFATTDNNEYAVVSKPPKGGASRNKVETTDVNAEYAVVSKPPKGGASRNEVQLTDANAEYAVVSKPSKGKGGAAKNNIGSTDNDNNEYAVVSKPPKGQETIYKNSAPAKSGAGKSSKEPKPGPSRKTNEDGLIYIDVEIKPQPGRGKGVIHGADDRNEYALVDFSKTAPPQT
ncbi:uncharacterized protein LOC117315992 isoform X2 [Pecten maximus]|uniref:uncharacterized protein LOC117315992 isoform X2 n=1 Tax=Pecten maximus TaxID=6579 RepID=UPI0014586F4E|nr:uncharacterized protein LOC117315992 isoform X2 [Pecten maximus]